jgi:ubiquinone/menaquinone biosynthesis C-methylase UbiE
VRCGTISGVSEYAATYDALSSRYDDWADAVSPDPRSTWVAKLDAVVAPGERVVELGCGTGSPVGLALAARFSYSGVDASAGMLGRARARLPHATFVHCDMEEVSFPVASLGGVVALYSIVHVPRERHAGLFGAIASWLRPGGVLVATVHSRDDEDDFEPNWLGAGPMRWSGFDAATNLSLIEAAGLEVVESQTIEQIEPGGTRIRPLWLLARRGAR